MTSPASSGQTVTRQEVLDAPSNALTVSLDAPGMTSLHRVGVAGLWMTLEALDGQPALKKPILDAGGNWDRDTRSAVLHWSGESSRFFQTLRIKGHPLVRSQALAMPLIAHPRALTESIATFLQQALAD